MYVGVPDSMRVDLTFALVVSCWMFSSNKPIF